MLLFMTWPIGNKLLVVFEGKVVLLAMVWEEKELLVGWVMEERLLFVRRNKRHFRKAWLALCNRLGSRGGGRVKYLNINRFD